MKQLERKNANKAIKKSYVLSFLAWNMILFLVVLGLAGTEMFQEKAPVQYMAGNGSGEMLRLCQDDEIVFQFENSLETVDNLILKFSNCMGLKEGNLSVRIYDDAEEYYTYEVPVWAFWDEVFYLNTEAIEDLNIKGKYNISIAVSGLTQGELILNCLPEEEVQTLKGTMGEEDYSGLSPFWGYEGITLQLSPNFAKLYPLWILLDIFFVVGIAAFRKHYYLEYSILILLAAVSLYAGYSFRETVNEERVEEYSPCVGVFEFVNIPLKDGELVQSFVAGYDDMEQFTLIFDNYTLQDAANVNVTLEDAKGVEYYSWNSPISNLAENTFYLGGVVEKELKQGKKYYLHIALDQPTSGITVRAISQLDMHSSLKGVTQAGAMLDNCNLYLFQSYRTVFGHDTLWWCVLGCMAVLLLGIIFCDKERCLRLWNVVSIILLLLIGYFNMENLSGNLYLIELRYIWKNCLIILCAYLVLHGLLGRGAYYLSVVLVTLSGLVNFYVLQFRGTEFLLTDIKSFFTAMSVAGNYDFMVTVKVYTSVLLAVCLLVLNGIVDVRCRRKYTGIKPVVRGGLVLSGVAVLWIMVGSLKSYDLNYFDIGSNFAKYGWCYANLYLVKFSSVEKPDHYSDKEVESILSQMDNDSERTGVVKPKNLIVIMNESFGDIGLSGGLETNQDYMPYIRGLKENTVKGNLHVNTFGGNTCISEYEFLTGNTMHFLPTGIVPYTSVCEDSEEGLVKILQAQGYYTVAMHPYGPSNWNRDKIYPAMGFEEFLSLEDYEDPELLRNYVSDMADYQKIIEYYENFDQDKGLFIFNVTMQNHGGYDIDNGWVETTIEIENFESSVAETYLSLVKRSDEAFEYLLSYFSEVEEPTMIVMFGDHLPALPEQVYEQMYGKKLSELEECLQYISSYIIWTNYDSNFEQVENISANYLGSLVLDYAGLEMPRYNEFLLELREEIPVIALGGMYNAQGQYIWYEDSMDELLEDYQMLQYLRMEDRKSKFYNIFQVER